MSKLNGGDMVQNVVSKTCKTLSIIEYDEGFNSLDSEIYIKYIRLVILNFCRIFSDPNSDLHKLITCDNLNNIRDFNREISDDNKKNILDSFFNKDVEKFDLDCKMKSDFSEKSDNEEEDMQGGEDLPTTKKPVKLNDGWLEKENLQGKKYWYNENTREISSVQPEVTKTETKEDTKEETKEDEPEEDAKEETKEEPEEEIVLNKSDMSKKLLQSMVGLENNTKENKTVALEILNVLFNNKIIEIIKKDQAVVALLATFINNLYKQTRKYTNKDIIKNMQFCLEPFSQIAYIRHISEKLSLHDEYYKHTLNMIDNEKHLYLIPILINHIQKYFIEIDNMIDIDMVLKKEIISSLKKKLEIVYKDNDAEQSRIINTFINDMDNISKLNEPLIDILIPKDNIQGGKKTRSKYRKARKSRKFTKRRKSH
jgi:DNA-binding protein H-NS